MYIYVYRYEIKCSKLSCDCCFFVPVLYHNHNGMFVLKFFMKVIVFGLILFGINLVKKNRQLIERPLGEAHLIRVLRLPGSRPTFIEQDLDPVRISILQCVHSAFCDTAYFSIISLISITTGRQLRAGQFTRMEQRSMCICK
jgi:hypothetical protein